MEVFYAGLVGWDEDESYLIDKMAQHKCLSKAIHVT